MGELLGGRWYGVRRWLGGEAKEKQREKKRAGRKEKKVSAGFFWENQGKRGGRRYQLKLGGRNVLKSVSGMSPWCLPHAFFLTVMGFNHL